MARRSKTDWLEAGVRALAAEGRGALTIERMTADLGVTKGSYYHHFGSAADFEEQVVRHWADAFLATTAALPEGPIPIELLDTVVREAFGPTTLGEAAVRAWARDDPRMLAYVERVDAARQGFLRRVLGGRLSGPDLEVATDTLEVMLVGAIEVVPPLAPERVFELYLEFKRRFLPAASAVPAEGEKGT